MAAARSRRKEGGELLIRNYYVYARLKPGVTLGQARSEMNTIAKRLETADPRLN